MKKASKAELQAMLATLEYEATTADQYTDKDIFFEGILRSRVIVQDCKFLLSCIISAKHVNNVWVCDKGVFNKNTDAILRLKTTALKKNLQILQ